MNLYELTKKYSNGKGEDMMWKTLSIVSDAVESSMSEEDKKCMLRKVYGAMSDGHYNEEFAHEDIAKMYYIDRDRKKHYAPYWSDEDLKSIYQERRSEIPEYNCWDFAVTMSMIKSDYCPLLMSWFPGIGEEERNDKIVQLAINWLKDDDNPFGKSKTWRYLNSK